LPCQRIGGAAGQTPPVAVSTSDMTASTHRARLAPPELAAYNERIPYLIGAISNLLSSRSSRFYQRSFGIGLGEMRLMWVMSYVPSLTVRRAAQIMGIDKGATSRSLAGLVRRRLVRVTVDKTDNRRRIMVFTEAGKTLCDRIMIVSAERERWLSNIFSPDELLILRDLLNKLLDNAREVSGRDPPPSGED
jgi:DNA-binding MarR family transcriptional regulator